MTHDFPPAPTARGRDDPRFATGTRMRPIFTATALLLAALGIYGVISDPVTRRAHELGIRIALGSPRREIGGLVLRHRMRLAAIGIAGRLVAALALARLMAGLLYGIPPAEAPMLGRGAAARRNRAAACYIPTRRATQSILWSPAVRVGLPPGSFRGHSASMGPSPRDSSASIVSRRLRAVDTADSIAIQ